MKSRFNEVCYHAVKEKGDESVPKYHLFFASRHPDALLLMNNEMVKSQKTLAEAAKPSEPSFFELRSEELVPDLARIKPMLSRHASTKIKRKELILKVIREDFCKYSESEIRGEVEKMLKTGELISSTGKSKINDDVEVWLRS